MVVILVDGSSWILSAVMGCQKRLPGAPQRMVLDAIRSRMLEQCSSWIHGHQPRTLWVAMNGQRSRYWRRDIMQGYKQQSEDRTEEVLALFRLTVEQIMPMFGFFRLSHPCAEAIDIIHVARNWIRERNAEMPFVIFSRDRCLLQLVDRHTVIKDFWEQDLLAFTVGKDFLWQRILSGDTAEGISGVDGLAPKDVWRIAMDSQYRSLWLKDHPESAHLVKRNAMLMDLCQVPDCVHQPIVRDCQKAW